MNLTDIRRIYREIHGDSPTAKVVSLREATEILRGVDRLQRVRLLTRVEPTEVKKSGNPYANNLVRVSLREAFVKIDYELGVNEQRVAEDKMPSFRAAPRKWGEHVDEALIEHTKKDMTTHRYLAVEVIDEIFSKYYTKSNVEVPKEDLAPFIKPKPIPKRQQVDNPLQYRNYEMSNILGFSLLDQNGNETDSYLINLRL